MAYPLPFMKGRYIQGRPNKQTGSHLAAHLKYNQYRKLGPQEKPEDRYIFSSEDEHVQRKDAVIDMMLHTANNVLYHKIILSPGEQEHVADFRQWTRDIMSDLQERKGVELHWYAVVHAHPRENTDEPHVHLVLASDGDSLQTGQMEMVRMDGNDYAFLRARGREHSNFEFYQEQQRELDLLNAEDITPPRLSRS